MWAAPPVTIQESLSPCALTGCPATIRIWVVSTVNRGGLPGRAAFQRNPCIDDGSGSTVGAQGGGAGGEAVLRRPRVHKEPQWAGGVRCAVAGFRDGRNGSGADDAGVGPRSTEDRGRCRQEVRRAGIRDDLPLVHAHAARGDEATALSPRPADEPSLGVRGELAVAGAGRGGVRLAGDRRGREEAASVRRGPQRPLGGDGSGDENLVRMAKLMSPP